MPYFSPLRTALWILGSFSDSPPKAALCSPTGICFSTESFMIASCLSPTNRYAGSHPCTNRTRDATASTEDCLQSLLTGGKTGTLTFLPVNKVLTQKALLRRVGLCGYEVKDTGGWALLKLTLSSAPYSNHSFNYRLKPTLKERLITPCSARSLLDIPHIYSLNPSPVKSPLPNRPRRPERFFMVYQIRIRVGPNRVPNALWEGTKEELIKAFPLKTHPQPVWRWVGDAITEPPQVSATFSLWSRMDRDSEWGVADEDPRLK